jgi:hypothetical protein
MGSLTTKVLDLMFGPPDPVEPEPEPPPPARNAEAKPGSQAWFRQLRPAAPDPNAISMNSLTRTIPTAKPPRQPGRQGRRSNGLWEWPG